DVVSAVGLDNVDGQGGALIVDAPQRDRSTAPSHPVAEGPAPGTHRLLQLCQLRIGGPRRKVELIHGMVRTSKILQDPSVWRAQRLMSATNHSPPFRAKRLRRPQTLISMNQRVWGTKLESIGVERYLVITEPVYRRALFRFFRSALA